ncbi:MAG: HsmA family protein [Caldilineaceae bacterium]
MLPFAIVTITTALALYTIGVWTEWFGKRLKGWHLAFFLGGLLFDIIGTESMRQIAGGFQPSLHGFTGLAALLLMLVHAIWATVTLVRNREQALANFHQFSIIVWLIWLIPYMLGAFLNVGVVQL